MRGTKGALFLNPSSGAKLSGAERRALEDAASDAGLEVIPLTGEVDIGAMIRERMQQGWRLFAAAGGDGTITNVVQSLVHTEATLAVIPVGTYNHFARDVGIPLDWRSALEVALNGTSRQLDVARVNERYFVNNLSLGLYPELVARREERGRDYPRWKARLYGAYHTFRKYPHVTLTLETEHKHEVIRTHVFIASNNSYDLSRIGIEAPRSTLSEGRLSLYWLPHLPRIALMKFCANYLAGRVTSMPGFRSYRTMRMKVHASRPHIDVGIDGEVFTLSTPLTITTAPSSLLVKVPRGVAPL